MEFIKNTYKSAKESVKNTSKSIKNNIAVVGASAISLVPGSVGAANIDSGIDGGPGKNKIENPVAEKESLDERAREVVAEALAQGNEIDFEDARRFIAAKDAVDSKIDALDSYLEEEIPGYSQDSLDEGSSSFDQINLNIGGSDYGVYFTSTVGVEGEAVLKGTKMFEKQTAERRADLMRKILNANPGLERSDFK